MHEIDDETDGSPADKPVFAKGDAAKKKLGKPSVRRPRASQHEMAIRRLELQILNLKLKIVEESIAANANTLEKRSQYANKVFRLLAVWTGAVFVLVVCSGLPTPLRVNVEKGVLLAVVTTTTIQFIALLVIVLKFYFPATDKFGGEMEMPPVPKQNESESDAKTSLHT